MQPHNMGPEIRATGQADLMMHDDETKQWISCFADGLPATVQVIYDRTSQTFLLVVSRIQDQRIHIVVEQQIFHNMKYQTNNNHHFHQWRGEHRRVHGLRFSNEQHAMDVHRAVREAQSFLSELLNSEQMNGVASTAAVYEEPQQPSHYYSHHQHTGSSVSQQSAQPPLHHESASSAYRDADGESLGSNGAYRKHSHPVHPQVIAQAIHPSQQQQTTNYQQQQAIQQQRRDSRTSTGSSSIGSGNIYATAHTLNGYNSNGGGQNAVASTGAMTITQIHQQQQQAPPTLRQTNGHPPNGMNGHHHAQQNGHHHHQVPIRTPVPPAPAPQIAPMPQQAPVHTPAPVCQAPPPPPPPPPPPANNGQARIATNAPPPPPPPPANFLKPKDSDKGPNLADELKNSQTRLRKTETNGSGTVTANGNPPNGSTNPTSSKIKPPAVDFMSELNHKLRKINNQAEVGSMTSTSSTLSSNSSESEKREPPPAPKPWQKNANVVLSVNSTTTTATILQNGHVNGVDSPKTLKKQISVSNGSAASAVCANDEASTIMCTKADLDQLRTDVFAELNEIKKLVLEAVTNKR